MANLFNNYMYGKAGKADYTPDQLPSNRVALFFEMLRIRFSGLIGLNLIYVLMALPALVWTVMTVLMLSVNLSDESVLAVDALSLFQGTLSTYLLLLIPCLAFTSALTPGIVYVLRNWARDQHTFTFSDMKDAIKGNWKNGLLLGLINGFSLLLIYVGYVYYGSMSQTGGAFWVIPQTVLVVIGALWWMANMLITPMMVTYDMKFSTLVRNAFIMTLARLPLSFLIWGISVAFPLVLILFVPYGLLIAAVVYLLIGFSLTFFVYVSYANSCFDRFLNPRIEGAQVNMGLRDPSLMDEDEEVTDEDIKNL